MSGYDNETVAEISARYASFVLPGKQKRSTLPTKMVGNDVAALLKYVLKLEADLRSLTDEADTLHTACEVATAEAGSFGASLVTP